jgi:transposase
MQIKSILNRVEKNKSFVYGKARWSQDGRKIEVPIEPRKNSRPVCSECHKEAPGYDRLKVRRFQYVPLWGIAVVFLYAMRRVNCPRCGVKVEDAPWAQGKSPMTRTFSFFLASWARRLAWNEVANIFGTTWNRVYDAVRWVVEYGLANRDLSGVTAIGVDEIQYRKGHNYLTLVYQINEGARRLLYVGKERTAKTLLRFFRERGPAWCENVRYVCSDMWKPYLKVIAKKLTKAVHILDRYHIVAKLNDAVDKVRRTEAKRLEREGFENVLKKSKYCFLKRNENLTEKQRVRLKDVLRYDLKSVRAYLLKESFQLFWEYTRPYWASWFLKKWCARAMRSRLEPIKAFVRTLRRHEHLILNWFKARKEFSSGAVEGLNRKVNLITRRSYGHRSLDVLQVALYHTLGRLPEPNMTHEFW